MASEQMQTVIAGLRAQPLPTELGIDALRASMESWVVPGVPDGVTTELVDAGGVPAEWVRADGVASDAALLYLHGGGYCIGSINTHRNLAARLSMAAKVPVLVIDYRLAPEHPHPAAVTDATRAYGWLLSSGLSPARLAIAGDSAGGGLTFSTLVSLRDAGTPLPACAVAISPWTDMACASDSYNTRAGVDPMVNQPGLRRMAAWFLNGQDPTDPLASPLHADLRGLPPLLVHVGDHEVLLEDSVQIAKRAADAGVDVTLEVWDEMIHVFHAFVGFVPEADDGVAEVGKYLARHIH